MKLKKFTGLFRGFAATTATLLALSTVGYSIAKSPLALGWVDGFFGIDSREIWEEKTDIIEPSGDGDFTIGAYKKRYVDEKTGEGDWAKFVDAFKAHAEKQGEEGFVLMKNDNAALPLAADTEVVLFGHNAYYAPSTHTGGPANNADKISLYDGLKKAGVKLNTSMTVEEWGLNPEEGRSGAITYENGMQGAKENYTVGEVFEAKDSWVIDEESTAIVVLGRGGGEGANYIADSATNAEDPLALSDEEKEMITYAKENCAKVVVLVVTANAMELGPISKGGDLEVDAIGFCGIPNDYQYAGIARVLAGKANATGAMSDTFVYDNSYTPAVINMGEQQYEDADIVEASAENPDPLGRTGGNTSYLHENYIVEAEGVYVGYKYYETRYYDSIVNPDFNAKATTGSTTGEAWDYKNEVLYTFGHGLSYVPYSQEVIGISMSVSEYGNVTATVKVTNEGDKDGYFLAQLYVQRPYTEYDQENLIEKSAVDFLNSKKVEVKKGESVEVEISVPTKYLASWDSEGAGTYVLDAGDYYFTAANGAHEAVNNILGEQGYTTDGTTAGSGKAAVWTLDKLDTTTFATSTKSGVEVKVENQADDGVDINYWLPGAVTYLSRSDWDGTFPKNYTDYTNDSGIESEPKFKIADSEKKDEWINALRNVQYTPKTDGNETNVEGILPAEVANGTYENVWQWIMSYATSSDAEKQQAFFDIKSDMWKAVGNALSITEAFGKIFHGGNRTDDLVSIGNPESLQSESVMGYQQTVTKDGISISLNIASNTLLGSSFNPDLAYEWGLFEGESGLWLSEINRVGAYTVWGSGLNLHRHAYNGRNSEYMSEDPMLTNRLGYEQYRGAMEMGSINGPKHMSFNDQELNRDGNACYMNEQKMRETDIRCYEGALSDAHANGVMMSFSRLGAINCTNHVGLMKNIMREEWGFTGIITTDMGRSGYHEGYSLVMATCTQYAEGRNNDSFLGSGSTDNTDEATDGTFRYITIGAIRKDPALVAQARENCVYELYTIAHSATGGVRYSRGEGATGPIEITRLERTGMIEYASWEYIFFGLIAASAALTVLAGVGLVESIVIKEEK